MSQFLIVLLRFLVPFLTAALVMFVFNTFFIALLLVLLLKPSIKSGALSRALLVSFLAWFFVALLVMIFVVAFFPNGNNLFMTDTIPLPLCLTSAPLYLLLIFTCGGNLDLGTLLYLATKYLTKILLLRLMLQQENHPQDICNRF